MQYEFHIPGKLPGMNQFINAQNANRYKGAALKKDAQKKCLASIKNWLKNTHVTKPVRLHYIWYEPNMRRDLDNIAGFGHKVIQDALVEAGVLADDGWKNIVGYTDTFAVDKAKPHIVVLMEVVDART